MTDSLKNRRNFLHLAAAAGVALPLSSELLFAQPTPSVIAGTDDQPTFQVFRAPSIDGVLGRLRSQPGNDDLIASPALALSATITVEDKKTAPKFEYHELRDHIFQILDGSTRYEVGGTPKDPTRTKPGEWLTTVSEGHTIVDLQKGDFLVVPRMTPHRRITEHEVSFLLISATSSKAT